MFFKSSKLLLTTVLLVTSPAWAALTVNGDGTVTDTTTGLVWDRCAYGVTGPACAGGGALWVDWPTALTTAAAANAAHYKGFNDWRVPNVKELESIVRIDRSSPAIDSTAFPATHFRWFWTSTSYAPNPAVAWDVDFFDADSGVEVTSNSGYVRLVRSGQSLAAFDALATNADLSVTVTDGASSATPGGSVTYTIVASNAGADAVSGATVADSFPAACTSVSWTCAGSGGGSCAASGSGNISDSTVGLPVGASVSYTAVCSIDASASGSLVNTASVSGTSNTDPTPGNNSASDTDTISAPAGPASIPTLSEWGMILLSGLLALLAWGRVRRPMPKG